MPAEEAAGAAAASGSDTATVDYAAHPHAGADEVPERPVRRRADVVDGLPDHGLVRRDRRGDHDLLSILLL
eukprot:COSAG06_NODE_2261_length_7212_cov_80.772951_13_plen_70_part_01